MLTGDRVSLCRLLSSLDEDDLSSDEKTFFEWSRKSSSFSELSAAFGARRLLHLCAKLPQLEGQVLPTLLLELQRSFLANVNSLFLVPNWLDLPQLPLVLCAHFMRKQASKHIVWITTREKVHMATRMAHDLASAKEWHLQTPEHTDEEHLNRGEGSEPTLDIVTPDIYAAMLRSGAPMSRVSLILVSCPEHLLNDASPLQADLKFIFKRYRDESPIVRPTVALLYENFDALPLALSTLQPSFSKHVPQLNMVDMSSKELERMSSDVNQELVGYVLEFPLLSPPADVLLRALSAFVPSLLDLYAQDSELESHKGRYKLETATKDSPNSELLRRAKYFDPLLPYYTQRLPIIHDNGSVNKYFTALISSIERNWEKSPPKLILTAMVDLCTAITLLSEVGILDALSYISKRSTKLVAAVGKRTGKNNLLDSLFDSLASIQTTISNFRAEYIDDNAANANPSEEDTKARNTTREYRGKCQSLLDLLKTCVPENRESNAGKEQVGDSETAQRTGVDTKNWKARIIVHVSNSTVSKRLKHAIEDVHPSATVYSLGEASDDVTCDSFFAPDVSSPSVLISIPNSSKVLRTHYQQHCRAHATTTAAKFIPGAQYGPHRNSKSFTPAPASHTAFDSRGTTDSVIILRLDTVDVRDTMKELQVGPVGQVLVDLKSSNYSLVSRLDTIVTRTPEYVTLVAAKRDIIEEATRILEVVKMRQLKVWSSPTSTSNLNGFASENHASNGSAPIMNGGTPWGAEGTPMSDTHNFQTPRLGSTPMSQLTPPWYELSVQGEGNGMPTPMIGQQATAFTVEGAAVLGATPGAPHLDSSVLSDASSIPGLLSAISLNPGADVALGNVFSETAPVSSVPSMTPYQKTMSQQKSFVHELLEMDESALSTKQLPSYAMPPPGLMSTNAPPSMPQSSEKFNAYTKNALKQQTLASEAPSLQLYGAASPYGQLTEGPVAMFAASPVFVDSASAMGTPNFLTSQAVNGLGSPGLLPISPLAALDRENDIIFPPGFSSGNISSLGATPTTAAPPQNPFVQQQPLSNLQSFLMPTSAPSPTTGISALHNTGSKSSLSGLNSTSPPGLSMSSVPFSSSNNNTASTLCSGSATLGGNTQGQTWKLAPSTSLSLPPGFSGTTSPSSSGMSLVGMLPSPASSSMPPGLVLNGLNGASSGLQSSGSPSPSIVGANANPSANATMVGASAANKITKPSALMAMGIVPAASNTNSDPISLLHIHFSRQGTPDPVYEEVMCGGVDHARQYMSSCTLASGEKFQGWGTRKKDAKKAAAAYALEYVTGQPASQYFENSASNYTHRPGPQATSFDPSAATVTLAAAAAASTVAVSAARPPVSNYSLLPTNTNSPLGFQLPHAMQQPSEMGPSPAIQKQTTAPAHQPVYQHNLSQQQQVFIQQQLIQQQQQQQLQQLQRGAAPSTTAGASTMSLSSLSSLQQQQASKPTLISKLTPQGVPSPFSTTASSPKLSLSSASMTAPAAATSSMNGMGSSTPKSHGTIVNGEYIPTWLAGNLNAPSASSSLPKSTQVSNTTAAASMYKPQAQTSNATANGGQAKPLSMSSSSSPFSATVGGVSASVHSPYDATTLTLANPIGIVNEHHQKRGYRMPLYADGGRTAGSDHEPSFLCTVTLFDGRTYQASGSSKKDAKTNAALLAAAALGLTGN